MTFTYAMAFSFDLRCESVVFNSHTMGKSGLLDVYTQSLRAADPRDEGLYIIYQETTSAHDMTNV